MTTPLHSPDAPVGIFDSGVGGLSVLRHIRAQLPHEHLIYVADSGYAPYGDKPEALICARALALGGFLVAQGVKAIVVACNTATVAAIATLRAHYPDLIIVGVEPGLKPAAAASQTHTVGVLATESTLAGAKFLQLRDQIAAASNTIFLLQACHGLADQIEFGERDSGATDALLARFILPLLTQGADTLVLGCTHYPLVMPAIERLLAAHSRTAVTLIDTGAAVARQLARLLSLAEILRDSSLPAPQLSGYTSASASALRAAFTSLLGCTPPAHALITAADGRIFVEPNN